MLRSTRSRMLALALLLGASLLLPHLALAQEANATNFGLDNLTNIQLGRQPLLDTISTAINVILGILGIVAFVIILYGGFLWMSSRGEEKQVSRAKRVIIDGVIGLAIVLASWAIAAFVLNLLGRGTGIIGGPGGEDPCIANPADCAWPASYRYLVVTDFYPDTADAPKNSVIVATFNQNLNCATVTPQSVILSRGGTPLANVHLRCSGRTLTIRSGDTCPPPLDQFPVPPAVPNACGNTPPINQCLGPAATPSNPQCQPASSLASISQCPGLRGCGCYTPGSYSLLLKSGETGDHVEGTIAGRNYLQHDTTEAFTLGASLDTIAPRIASVDPNATTPPQTNVVRNRNVTVSFTRPVDPSSISVYNASPTQANQVSDISLATLVFRTSAGPISGSIVGQTTRSVVWRPTDACGGGAPAGCGCMPADAVVTVEVHDGVAGIHGASCLALDTAPGPDLPPGLTCVANDRCSYTFRTSGNLDLDPPVLDTTGVYPSAGDTNADRALTVGAPWAGRVLAKLTDASGIQAASVNTGTFQMVNSVPTMSVAQHSATEFGLQPGGDGVLAPNRTFMPTLYGWGGICNAEAGGVLDGAGNALAGRQRWQFRTGNQVNGGAPIITHVSPSTGPHGQCVTILGYNLGCTTLAGNVDGPAQSNRWTGNSCSPATSAGEMKVTDSSGSLVAVPAGDIISWDEINRPEGGPPPNYSPQNQILITVPSAAANNPSGPGDVVVYPAYTPGP